MSKVGLEKNWDLGRLLTSPKACPVVKGASSRQGLLGGVAQCLLFYSLDLATERVCRHPGRVTVKPVWH